MRPNYQTICQNLIKDLPQRIQDVIEQRFGLKGKDRKTLEAIGKDYGITRERVRQIEEVGFAKIKPKLKEYSKVFQYFKDYLSSFGGLRKEDVLLNTLGESKFQNQVLFLLALEDSFKKFYQTKDLHSFWTTDEKSLDFAKETLSFLYKKFTELNHPLTFEETLKEVNSNFKNQPFASKALQSFLEISKIIKPGLDRKYGLKNWPEIKPKGVKDKAYLVLQKEKKPLHFTEVTNLINSQKFREIFQEKALTQTVHNELIKDPRFILVGRGLYALREWGYQPGVVKDIIAMVMEKEKKPLAQEAIVKEVLKQRMVKVSTILINLKDQKHFQRNTNGKYYLA